MSRVEIVYPNAAPIDMCLYVCYYECSSTCWEDPYMRYVTESVIYQVTSAG